eukprot:scaffold51578_cov63-Phaeocystis_antarctica.AAC.6
MRAQLSWRAEARRAALICGSATFGATAERAEEQAAAVLVSRNAAHRARGATLRAVRLGELVEGERAAPRAGKEHARVARRRVVRMEERDGLGIDLAESAVVVRHARPAAGTILEATRRRGLVGTCLGCGQDPSQRTVPFIRCMQPCAVAR